MGIDVSGNIASETSIAMYVEVRLHGESRDIARTCAAGGTGKNEEVEPISARNRHRIAYYT